MRRGRLRSGSREESYRTGDDNDFPPIAGEHFEVLLRDNRTIVNISAANLGALPAGGLNELNRVVGAGTSASPRFSGIFRACRVCSPEDKAARERR